MAGYTEITLIAETVDELSFDILYEDGTPKDLSSYTTGKMTITNMETKTQVTISTVTLGGTTGNIKVNIAKTDIPESFISESQSDVYGKGNMTHAWSVWADDTVMIRGKASVVKAG